MELGVISFPGSNGDHDAMHALGDDLGASVWQVDYRATNLDGLDAIVLPGGFAYGDALRCGAIARFSPVMEPLRQFAAGGKPVLGICNGFQVLCEAHLLPGALLRNQTLRFHCYWAHVSIERTETAWTSNLARGEVLRLPVAHGEGSFYVDDAELARLEANHQIVARYCDADGADTEEANQNGSVSSIAAVCNEVGNVVGFMPHPERATDSLVGGDDGRRLLLSVFDGQIASR